LTLILVLFYQKEDTERSIKDCWDSPDTPALSTCSNADTFRRINAILDNSLDFSGVCTTPVTKSKRDILPGDVFGWDQGKLEDLGLAEGGICLVGSSEHVVVVILSGVVAGVCL